MIKFGTDFSKLKKNLKLACARLKLLQAKRLEQSERLKLEIANYLKNGKYVLAKIKAQKIINDKSSAEAMEIIGMYCEELLEKYELFEQRKRTDITLKRPISSLIWSAPYYQTHVPELQVVAKQMAIKYGPRYIKMALKNEEGTVDSDLITRVIAYAPSDEAIEKCLKNISLKYGITYTKSKENIQDEGQDIKNCDIDAPSELSQEGEIQLGQESGYSETKNTNYEESEKFPKSVKNIFRLTTKKKPNQNSNETKNNTSNDYKTVKDVSASDVEKHLVYKGNSTLIAENNEQTDHQNSPLATKKHNDVSFNTDFAFDYNNQMDEVKNKFSECISMASRNNIESTTKSSFSVPTASLSQNHKYQSIIMQNPTYNEPPPSYDMIYSNDLRTVSGLNLHAGEVIDLVQLPSCPTEEPERNSSNEDVTVKFNARAWNNFWNN